MGEAHYHFDDIKITSINNGTLLDLKFDDGPYADFANHVYNTNDERIMKITSAPSTSYFPYKSYIYNGNGMVMAEYKYNKYDNYPQEGDLVYNYIYGNGQKLANRNSGGIYQYYHNDYLGSVRAITNLGWTRDYYPFGNDKDASGTGNEYKFTGKEWDDESKLYYSWHRYYDPEFGRFTQVDPKWDLRPQESPYSYAGNNPLKRTDPDGNFWIGALVGGGLDYALQAGTNLIQGQDLYDALWTNVDMGDVFISAAVGATGAGIASKISKISKIGKAAQIAANTGTDAAVSAGSQYAKTGIVDPGKTVIDALTGTAVGLPVSSKVGKMAANSRKGKILTKQADNIKRRVKNRPERRQIKAKKSQARYNDYVGGRATGAGIAASGTASTIFEKEIESINDIRDE